MLARKQLDRRRDELAQGRRVTRAVRGAATVRGVRLAGIDAADRSRRALLAAEMERAPEERHGVYRPPSGPLASRANALVVIREPLLLNAA